MKVSFLLEKNSIYKGDCFNVIQKIDDDTIDLVLTDPPWCATSCEWDKELDFKKLFLEYKRVLKKDGYIVMFGNNPFTAKIITENLDIYKYNCVWVKPNATSPNLARKQPMRRFEDIMVFSVGKPVYHPIMSRGKPYKWNSKRSGGEATNIKFKSDSEINNGGTRFPTNVFEFPQERGIHPTQKPVKLFEYIVSLYTNEGMTVLDTFMGSGTTPIACHNTNRNFIAIEKDEAIFDSAYHRIMVLFDIKPYSVV